MLKGKMLEDFQRKVSGLTAVQAQFYLDSLDREILRIERGGKPGCQSLKKLKNEKTEALKVLAQKG